MTSPGEHKPFHQTGRALVFHPFEKSAHHAKRLPEDRLAEAVGLTVAIGQDVVHSEVVSLNRIRPATLIGPGKVEEYKELVREKEIEVAIVDSSLSPVQQRNLENALNCKVVDRTGLILEIFAQRARTREGVLQVDLAQLTYQRSRLVRAWTHLERQRGSTGTVGGPGERQIESDRRAIDNRIALIKGQLEEVTRTRELHRKRRRDAPFPVVALVGYTNAGKSTLFNRLSSAKVYAEDQLFATLDPTMRGIELPSGRKIILSDTVGFISDLPTQLVAAFRATLEEVLEADVLLHIRDISHHDTEAQKDDVLAVLGELGVSDTVREEMLEVLNKCDQLDEDQRALLTSASGEAGKRLLLSAITGEGVDSLLERIDELLRERRDQVRLRLEPGAGAALAWIYRNGEVLEREDKEDGAVILTVALDRENVGRLQKQFAEEVQLLDLGRDEQADVA